MPRRPLQVAVATGLEVHGWDDKVSLVVEAERLGVASAWCSEAWGSDAIAPLGYLAAKTTRMRLGTAILQAGTRTPALVGMTTGTLQVISGGRFILGLGVSGPQVIEGFHGIPFDRAVTRMRETVEVVRQVLDGEPVRYDGRVYQLPREGGEGKAIRSSMGRLEPVPVYLATLSPKSLEMTGAIADGWLAASFMPEHASVFTDHLRAGAATAGRDFDALDLHVGGTVVFTDDVEAAIAARKPDLAFAMGAMGSRAHNYYNEAYQRAGYAEVALEIQRLWLDGRRVEARALVPDDMVVKSNLIGTDAMVRDRIRAYRDAGVTTLQADLAEPTLAGQIETLGRFMRLVNEVNAE